MKKQSMVCAIFLLFGAGFAFAQAPTYQFADAGTKNFITAPTITVNTQISLDLYLTNVGAPQTAGGAYLDFTGSTAEISYVSGGRCFNDGSEGCTGPWTNGAGTLVNEAGGPGTLLYVVANLGGAAPDSDGDLIVGTVTLQNTGPNDATLNFGIGQLFSVWTPIRNIDTVEGQIVISQVCHCTIDEDCDDGLFCNGTETCDAPNCTCEPATNPCPTDTTCNEDTDRCDPILTASSIPTLSEWGMIIFMTIILGIGVVTLVRRRMV